MRTLMTCVLALCAGAVWGAGVVQGGKPPLTKGSAPPDVSARIEKLGNPLAKRYPDGSTFHYSRTVSDLQVFDGKLYIGHGDIVLNSGPTDVWYYDLRKKAFVKQGQIEDEAADHYRIINGRLYLPGMDPREDWTLGNFYRLEDGQWVKHRTLPGSVHNSDIVGVGNTLFAVSARAKAPMCLMTSTDDGKTWKLFDAPAGNQRIERRLIVLNGSVYIPTVAANGTTGVFRFNGKGFDRCTGDMLPGTEPPVYDNPTFRTWSALEKLIIFKGQVIYIGVLH